MHSVDGVKHAISSRPGQVACAPVLADGKARHADSTPMHVRHANSAPLHVRIFAMLTWMTCSVAIVLFNKLVLSKFEFNFPVTLTLLHCAANSAVLFVVFECCHLLPSPYRQQGAAKMVAATAPIAGLFAVSTILRNAAFVYLPVATIQLLSSGAPVVVYVLSCAMRLDSFQPALGGAVLIIAGGCAWATSASITTLATSSYRGLTYQTLGLLIEALRGVLLKKMMVAAADESQSSLGLLYMVAPVAFGLLAVPAAATELQGAVTFVATRGYTFHLLLCVNVVMAVCLNFSSFFFIKTCAITTTSVAALVKDCLLILGSYMLHPETATVRVVAGYGVTLSATCLYTSLRRRAVQPVSN